MRDWLIQIRGRRSQYEMADDLGISQSFYAALETGGRNPSVKLAKILARQLGVGWQMFFDDSAAPAVPTGNQKKHRSMPTEGA